MRSRTLKLVKTMWSELLFYFILLRACFGQPWQRSTTLDSDGKVRISWNITKAQTGDLLDLQVSAPTTGYVGLGFSGNGAMRGSDIVVGWVDDDHRGHLRDFHGVGNVQPVLDQVQNYELIAADETEGVTTIRFQRPLKTCDDNDMDITNDTMRIIWAYEQQDPGFGGENVFFQYHGANNRGVKSVYLIDTPLPAPFPDDLEQPDPSIKYWDVILENNTVEAKESTYFCKIVKMPKLDKKHHMIGHRPLIQNRKNLHHLCLYECTVPTEFGGTASVFEKHLDHPGSECYTKNMPPDWASYCGGFFQCWVGGGDGEMFPEHVGATLGEEHGGTTYFMLEVHYDNPEKLSFTDTSGVRIFYTDRLREYDGGIVMASYRITPFMLIPPQQPDFHIYGFCSSECTEKALPPEGIKIVSVLLHAHLTGRRIKLRHFRNGAELPVIAEDKAYDFNYQQSRYLKKEITVLPGDDLLTECEFDTTDRDHPVLGGLSSKEEMCQSFLMYYPKVELSLCSSQYEFYNFFEALGITNVFSKVFPAMRLPYNPNTWPVEIQGLDPPDDSMQLKSLLNGHRDVYDLMEIEEPAVLNHTSVGDYLQNMNWKDRTKSKSVEKRWKEGKHYAYCTLSGRRRIPLKDYVTHFPRSELSPEFQEKDNHCAAQVYLSASASSLTSISSLLLAVASTLLFLSFRL